MRGQMDARERDTHALNTPELEQRNRQHGKGLLTQRRTHAVMYSAKGCCMRGWRSIKAR
jgi:hypothetical protein